VEGFLSQILRYAITQVVIVRTVAFIQMTMLEVLDAFEKSLARGMDGEVEPQTYSAFAGSQPISSAGNYDTGLGQGFSDLGRGGLMSEGENSWEFQGEGYLL
jgi:hypothetical protein